MQAASARGAKLRKYAVVASAKVLRLQETMTKLLPQIRYWLRTGWVAGGKIISLHIPQLYSIVRGKVGKKVEFGLSWGITRLRGGFLLATLACKRGELQDSKFALRAVKDCKALFGKAPRAYAYERCRLIRLGLPQVEHVPFMRSVLDIGEIRSALRVCIALVGLEFRCFARINLRDDDQDAQEPGGHDGSPPAYVMSPGSGPPLCWTGPICTRGRRLPSGSVYSVTPMPCAKEIK